MKLKPLGTRVLIKIIKKDEHIIGDKKLEIVGAMEQYTKFIVEDKGEKVDIPVVVGDEIRPFSNAHIDCHKASPGLGILEQTDIWAIVT